MSKGDSIMAVSRTMQRWGLVIVVGLLGWLPARPALGLVNVEVGRAPTEIVTVGDTAYVVNYGSSSVSVVDLKSGSVITTMAVGTLPAGLSSSLSGDRIFVFGYYEELPFPFPEDDCSSVVISSMTAFLSVINTATNSLEAQVELVGYPLVSIPASNGRDVWVPSIRGSVNRVDLSTMELSEVIYVDGAEQLHDGVLSPDDRKLFLSGAPLADDLFVLDTLTGEQRLLPLSKPGVCSPAGMGERMTIDPLGEYLFLSANCDYDQRTVVVSVADEIAVTVFDTLLYSIAYSPDGQYAYLLDKFYSGKGLVVDLATLEIVDELPIGGASAATSPDGSTLYVAEFGGTFRARVQMGPHYPQRYGISVVDLMHGGVTEKTIDQAELLCSFSRALAVGAEGKKVIVSNPALNTVSIFDTRTARQPEGRTRSNHDQHPNSPLPAAPPVNFSPSHRVQGALHSERGSREQRTGGPTSGLRASARDR